jgi:hypothetical protein
MFDSGHALSNSSSFGCSYAKVGPILKELQGMLLAIELLVMRA